MLQIIALITFIASSAVVFFILNRKIPALLQLPEKGSSGLKENALVSNVEKKVKAFHFNFFQKQVFLHKLLSYIKVLILKTETKIDVLLHRVRKKAQEADKKNGKNNHNLPL